MTAHESEEYIEEPPQRKRYAFRKPERQRDFLRLKLTLPSERRTGKPPPDPLFVLCRLQAHRGSRCSTVTKIPDTTSITLSILILCVGTCLSFLRMLYSSILHETNLCYSNHIIGCLCLFKFMWICILKFVFCLVLFFPFVPFSYISIQTMRLIAVMRNFMRMYTQSSKNMEKL